MDYNTAIQTGNLEQMETAKYELLWDTSNLLGIVTNFIALAQCGIFFDFGCSIISRGTKLYRIRTFDEKTDFSDALQWMPAPWKPQNRANRAGQAALYLASSERICLLETHIPYQQRYAVGTYECIEDIEVGGFLKESQSNQLHDMAGVVLNAFLIAPSRGEKNDELFAYLDSVFGKLSLDDLSSITAIDERGGLDLPFKFGVLNQGKDYYKVSNQLCDILALKTPCGIRYSSCYVPLETVGICCSDYNIVLYNEGIGKVKFIDYDVKTNESKVRSVDVVKCLCGV